MACNETWTENPADYPIVITSQADIDNPALFSPKLASEAWAILVQGAKGTLNFTNLKSFEQMKISCNIELQELIFPDLVTFYELKVDTAPALKRLTMDQWNGSVDANSPNRKFNQFSNLRLGRVPQLRDQQYNIPNLNILDLYKTGPMRFPKLTTTRHLTANGAGVGGGLHFPMLETVSSLFSVTNTEVEFLRLKNAGEMTFTNQAQYSRLLGGSTESTADLVVQGSLVIANQTGDPDDPTGWGLRLEQLTKVGEDLNITQNNGIPKFSFSHLTEVKRLNIIDNPGSTVPGDFSRLTDASAIHINGVIHSDTNSVLFPKLSSAGDVKIEPWNPEFDCSWFVRMRDQGKIGALSCNGTNGTGAGPSSSPTPLQSTPHNGLTTAASAGIGVGVGVVALGIMAALAWLIMHYRRRLRDVGGAGSSHKNSRDDPRETFGAKPETNEDGQILEAGGKSLPYQAGGSEILEAGGRALRAEAGDERLVAHGPGEAASPQQKRPPVELA
ncbi:hypothetical protein PG987_014351 [Apiospora arundinis]